MTTKLILVGGFLGAGKTTLLRAAAEKLTKRGQVVGLITNDQAPDLVDTALLSAGEPSRKERVREVAGSCFCCNFPGFIDAVSSLIDQGAQTIIAEPVGSCTDLSATILQPLKDRYRNIALAPLTVLVDPTRLLEHLEEKPSLMDVDARYILRLQMEEADRVLLNKVDTLSVAERGRLLGRLRASLPNVQVGGISAMTGEGLDTWLDEMFATATAGERVVEVDYDRYAHGEAVLGWLNMMADLRQTGARQAWGEHARRLMSRLHGELQARGAEIGHLKLVIASGDGQCVANLTRLGGELAVRDGAAPSQQAELTLNARVQMSPEDLEELTRSTLAALPGDGVDVEIRTLRCLMPGRPTPSFRYEHVVTA